MKHEVKKIEWGYLVELQSDNNEEYKILKDMAVFSNPQSNNSIYMGNTCVGGKEGEGLKIQLQSYCEVVEPKEELKEE